MKQFFKSEELKLLVDLASRLPNLSFQSEGGYFCYAVLNPAEPCVFKTPELRKVGNVPLEKQFGRMKNCLEKLLRIIEHSLKTSFEMRNESLNQWGGGIRYEVSKDMHIVSSFSGFPERVDEAICIIFTAVCISRTFEELAERVQKELES
jgi:hypothetical protein